MRTTTYKSFTYKSLLKNRRLSRSLGNLSSGLDTTTNVLDDNLRKLKDKFSDAPIPEPDTRELRDATVAEINARVDQEKTKMEQYEPVALSESIAHWKQIDQEQGSFTTTI